MGNRLKRLADYFSASYLVTGNIRNSIRFARVNGKGIFKTRLENKNIILRKNDTDKEVFIATFLHKYHRCPFQLGQKPVIVDLGSNIGLTMIDFKIEYPGAQIFGIEMDEENYELALKNIKGYNDCHLIHAAIWNKTGMVSYNGKDKQSLSVSATAGQKVKALTMNDFIKENQITKIDYLKMDIEGAEYDLILNDDPESWLGIVKYLSVEVHPGAGIESIKNALESKGFEVHKSTIHWSSLFATNKSPRFK